MEYQISFHKVWRPCGRTCFFLKWSWRPLLERVTVSALIECQRSCEACRLQPLHSLLVALPLPIFFLRLCLLLLLLLLLTVHLLGGFNCIIVYALPEQDSREASFAKKCASSVCEFMRLQIYSFCHLAISNFFKLTFYDFLYLQIARFADLLFSKFVDL